MVRKQDLQELLVLLETQQTATQKPLDITLQFGSGEFRHCAQSQGTRDAPMPGGTMPRVETDPPWRRGYGRVHAFRATGA